MEKLNLPNPRRVALAEARLELALSVNKIEEKHNLTIAEVVKILLEQAQEMNKCAIENDKKEACLKCGYPDCSPTDQCCSCGKGEQCRCLNELSMLIVWALERTGLLLASVSSLIFEAESAINSGSVFVNGKKIDSSEAMVTVGSTIQYKGKTEVLQIHHFQFK